MMRNQTSWAAGMGVAVLVLMPLMAEAGPCRPHHYRYPSHRSGVSFSISFGSPGYSYYPYGYYRPRTVYYAPPPVCYAPPTYIRRTYVNRSTSVARAQSTLNDLGYEAGTVDGLMGPRTRAALTRLQIDSGLPASGQLDAATTRRLGEFR